MALTVANALKCALERWAGTHACGDMWLFFHQRKEVGMSSRQRSCYIGVWPWCASWQ